MRNLRRWTARKTDVVIGVVGLALALGACRPVATLPPSAAPTAPLAPPTSPPIVAPIATMMPAFSFEAATYEDPVAGFALDYPASWTVGPTEQYSRGGITAFTSWSRPADRPPGETPPGETRMDVTVQQWDPDNDLEAFIAQRKGAWDASGTDVVSDSHWTRADGRSAVGFVVRGSDGAEAYFFFTTLGGDYLVISGSGDTALLAEIAATLR
jgi:hypothetical protein